MKAYIIARSTWGEVIEKEGIYLNLEKAMDRCRELAAETLAKERGNGRIEENYRGTVNAVWILGTDYSYVFQAREIIVNE
jgi:hypothetical protein